MICRELSVIRPPSLWRFKRKQSLLIIWPIWRVFLSCVVVLSFLIGRTEAGRAAFDSARQVALCKGCGRKPAYVAAIRRGYIRVKEVRVSQHSTGWQNYSQTMITQKGLSELTRLLGNFSECTWSRWSSGKVRLFEWPGFAGMIVMLCEFVRMFIPQ